MKNLRTKLLSNLLILLFVGISISCSKDSEDDSPQVPESAPETYEVTYEVLGTGKISLVKYSTTPGEFEKEYVVSLPFRKTITHKNRRGEEGIGQGEDHYIGHFNILLDAYEESTSVLGKISGVNLYIDGKLEDSQNSDPRPLQNNLYEWSCKFKYAIRGTD